MPKRRKKPPEEYGEILDREYRRFSRMYCKAQKSETETAKALWAIFREAHEGHTEEATQEDYDRAAWMRECMAWPLWAERN